MSQTLFDAADSDPKKWAQEPSRPLSPLAVRMRPRSLDQVIGQQHLLQPGSPLRVLAGEGTGLAGPQSLILWGPPGSGKTTLAHVISKGHHKKFVELSAITAGVKDVRAVMDQALIDRDLKGLTTVLFLDEIHRFNKAQQDALLPGVENRWVVLIAATTENPSFSVISPLLSRSLLLTLQALEEADLERLVDLTLEDQRGFAGRVKVSKQAKEHLVKLAGGDARKVLSSLEAAVAAADGDAEKKIAGQPILVERHHAEEAIDQAAVRYDRQGDQHYDVISAFIKSIRGSDPDAALHYLARMIHAGEDPRYIARRLVVHASEDIGLADPTALTAAINAAQAVQLIGLPEARINLAQATIHLALAPKSNAVLSGIDQALADIKKSGAGEIPLHLRDGHYGGAAQYGHGRGYIYPHHEPHALAVQQYLPDLHRSAQYYKPSNYGAEKTLKSRLNAIKAILGRAL